MEQEERLIEVFADTPKQRKRLRFITRFLGTFTKFVAHGLYRYVMQRIVPILVMLTWLIILGILAVESLASDDYVSGFWAIRMFGPWLSDWYEFAIWARERWLLTGVLAMLIIAVLMFTCSMMMKYKSKKMIVFRHFLRVLYGLPIIVIIVAHGVYIGANAALERPAGIEAYEARVAELGQFSVANVPNFDTLIHRIKNEPEFFQDRTLRERGWVYDEVLRFIRLQGGPLTLEQHLLRNYLNYAPETLEDLLAGRSEVRWRISTPFSSAYHMFGEDGEYNIKFLSEDGRSEAVYNKQGILLTAENDPVNMATYNFSSDWREHSDFDVKPYYVWGNVGERPTFTEKDVIDNIERFFRNREARVRYQEVRLRVVELYDRM